MGGDREDGNAVVVSSSVVLSRAGQGEQAKRVLQQKNWARLGPG